MEQTKRMTADLLSFPADNNNTLSYQTESRIIHEMTETSSNRISSVSPSTPSSTLNINMLWVEGEFFPSTLPPPSFLPPSIRD